MSLRSIHKSYKVELNPTQKQREILNKNFGCVRFTYNWCVNKFKENKENKEKRIPFSKFKYIREFVEFKRNNKEYSFLIEKDISSIPLQQVILNFDKSVMFFFKKGYGFPQYKKKGVCKDSYREYNFNINRTKDKKGSLRIYERRIHIPKLGWTKIKGKPEKYLPLNKTIQYITISKDVDRYFISILYKDNITIVDDSVETINKDFKVIGIDLGIKNLMTICHDDESMEIVENKDFTKKYSNKLAKEQKRLSLKKKGSTNSQKQRLKVAKIHRKIRNSRNDYIHKLTNYITSKTKNSVIMMEDLRTKSMIMNNNRILSRSLSNVSFNKIQQLMNYKSLRNGSRMELIPFNYPSTKMCCGCGNIKDMSLNDRVYECDNIYCVYYNRPIDRDYNSSINIRDYYFNYISQAVA